MILKLAKASRVLCLISLCIGLICACAPKYQTEYEYHPPESERGLSCLSLCQQSKTACQQTCRGDGQVCEEGQDCRQLANCQCEEDYQACYKLCGGRINARQTCIENCQ